MWNNSFIMKKIVLTLSLFLAFIAYSCDNSKQNNKNTTEKETVETKSNIKATKHPDTIIDGKQIYNFDVKLKKEEITLEVAIETFEKGVNEASSCEELIRACASFDNNIKKLSKTDSKITVVNVERREDVKAIRKTSEEKSLKLCQTQRVK